MGTPIALILAIDMISVTVAALVLLSVSQIETWPRSDQISIPVIRQGEILGAGTVGGHSRATVAISFVAIVSIRGIRYSSRHVCAVRVINLARDRDVDGVRVDCRLSWRDERVRIDR